MNVTSASCSRPFIAEPKRRPSSPRASHNTRLSSIVAILVSVAMVSMLDRVIYDFEEEVGAVKHERVRTLHLHQSPNVSRVSLQFSSLRYTLKRVLRSLRMMDSFALDGHKEETVLQTELRNLLAEAEMELGALLRTNHRHQIQLEHHQRITTFLQKLNVSHLHC